MRATFTTDMPQGVLENRNTRAIFQRDMLGSLIPVYEQITQSARGRTRHEGVAQEYQVQSVVSEGRIGLWIENRHPLFRILNDGSRPHVIVPKHMIRGGKLGFLRFEVGGRTVYTQHVNHPGTRGQKMVETAFEEHKDKVDRAIQEGTVAYMLDSLGDGG